MKQRVFEHHTLWIFKILITGFILLAFVLCCSCSMNTEQQLSTNNSEAESIPDITERTIPILLYHHLDSSVEESGTVLSPERFEHQLQLLLDNGYITISFDDIIAFVEQGIPLPENAVIITFDDGYMSNYEYAYPILKKHNAKATIFAIGCSIGHDKYYKDTPHEITPHFGATEIKEMTSSGLIDIHSHTYDMHQWAPFEDNTPVRESILPFEQESDDDYRQALLKDIEAQNQIFAACGLDKSDVMAFPRGMYSDLVNDILVSAGYKVTVTTDAAHINTLVYQDSTSLIGLGRMNIDQNVTDEEILAYCEMDFIIHK